MTAAPPLRRLALLGNHAPRQCGIATFTTDLADALTAAAPDLSCVVLAMNDPGRRYAYPDRVRFELREGDPASYRRAADFLNVHGAEVLSVQHEFGIYGGRAGAHLLALLRELRMPAVTTLHTVLAEPDPAQRAVMDELTRLSERLIVMSARGSELLQEVHGVPARKIDVIPHGIPELPTDGLSKARLGLEGRTVILTFGLLAPDKGIEGVVDALPEILARFPDVLYVVLGATHPHVKARHGEAYRLMLQARARRLGVEAHVRFVNRFVAPEELNEHLAAADLYVTPYHKAEQITSGTLAYAVGSGKAVLSTPYVYAKELLADGRGILVPWRDPGALAREVVGLLEDPERREALCRRAYEHGRTMTWPAVARACLASFRRARDERARWIRTFRASAPAEAPPELPEVSLDHLEAMTDGTGLLQHARHTVPRCEEGYCLDDNARALVLMTLLEESGDVDDRTLRLLATRYLAFTAHAFDASRGRFRNFMDYRRRWTEPEGSGDSQGRALWALGTVVGRSRDAGRRGLARDLLLAALGGLRALPAPRSWAFAILGLQEYLRAFEGDTAATALLGDLADRLLDLLRSHARPGWTWFEEGLTYCNARLPQALLAAGPLLHREELTRAGLETLAWLGQVQEVDGWFAPVGTEGWYPRGGTRARFDQQPVEAAATVSACLEAARVTGEARWTRGAHLAFQWFLGRNALQEPLADLRTGGCRDALHVDRVNENQGAESTLAFLLSLLEMRMADRPAEPQSVLLEVP